MRNILLDIISCVHVYTPTWSARQPGPPPDLTAVLAVGRLGGPRKNIIHLCHHRDSGLRFPAEPAEGFLKRGSCPRLGAEGPGGSKTAGTTPGPRRYLKVEALSPPPPPTLVVHVGSLLQWVEETSSKLNGRRVSPYNQAHCYLFCWQA